MGAVVTLIIAALIAAVDQISKYFVYNNLYPSGEVKVIDNLFSLVYTENRGAAFGIFQNGTVFFTILTSLMMAVFLFLIFKKKFTSKLFYAASALIIGGGIGNLIDRIFRGFVVDFLSLSFFPPVCNFADYCITIGAVLFVLSIILIPEPSKKDTAAETDSGSDNNE